MQILLFVDKHVLVFVHISFSLRLARRLLFQSVLLHICQKAPSHQLPTSVALFFEIRFAHEFEFRALWPICVRPIWSF
jgi:hypothetical protein